MLEGARGRSPVEEIGPRRRARRAGGGAQVDTGDGGEALRRRKRQRPQQYRIDDAEHRAVRADAKGEGEHGDDGEPWRLAEHAAREAKVARDVLEPGEAALVPLRLHGLRDASEAKSCCSHGATVRIPPAPFFVSGQLEMGSQLVFEITIGSRSAERAPQPMSPFAGRHCGSFRSECMMDAVRSQSAFSDAS